MELWDHYNGFKYMGNCFFLPQYNSYKVVLTPVNPI